MHRRNFLKMALAATAGVGTLIKVRAARGRGIPASALGTEAPGRCFVAPSGGPIEISLHDMFKIGPGPSSSHTIAPLRIAHDFRETLERLPAETMGPAEAINARLFGSLSATGRGHRTDCAVLAGLLGQRAETCDPELMEELALSRKRYPTVINGKSFAVSGDMIVWDKIEHDYPHVNTMVMELLADDRTVLFVREYYSTGGGFFSWKGQPPSTRGEPVHPYRSMAEFKRVLRESGKPLHEVLIDNEKAVMGIGEAEVVAHLDRILATMEAGVAHGLDQEGLLPAPFEFHRRAKRVYESGRGGAGADGFMRQLSGCAFAGAEGNAAGRLAVTAPTLGSAGTLPAVAWVMKHHLGFSRDAMRKGLIAAGLVGILCKQNGSVAGAEVGCQGEIGVASSMAAAMISYAAGADVETTEIAAASALEHHLGLSCDPVGGLVLIPCIERNAFGALKAYNAYLLAKDEIAARHWEDLDRVIAAMIETGRALPAPFKETGRGGLGVSMVDC
jgi:L-serine dehydratase